MNADLDSQIHRLDQALFRLLDERLRMQEELGRRRPVNVDDVLARHDGVLGAGAIRDLAAAIDRASGAAPAERGSGR